MGPLGVRCVAGGSCWATWGCSLSCSQHHRECALLVTPALHSSGLCGWDLAPASLSAPMHMKQFPWMHSPPCTLLHWEALREISDLGLGMCLEFLWAVAKVLDANHDTSCVTFPQIQEKTWLTHRGRLLFFPQQTGPWLHGHDLLCCYDMEYVGTERGSRVLTESREAPWFSKELSSDLGSPRGNLDSSQPC